MFIFYKMNNSNQYQIPSSFALCKKKTYSKNWTHIVVSIEVVFFWGGGYLWLGSQASGDPLYILEIWCPFEFQNQEETNRVGKLSSFHHCLHNPRDRNTKWFLLHHEFRLGMPCWKLKLFLHHNIHSIHTFKNKFMFAFE